VDKYKHLVRTTSGFMTNTNKFIKRRRSWSDRTTDTMTVKISPFSVWYLYSVVGVLSRYIIFATSGLQVVKQARALHQSCSSPECPPHRCQVDVHDKMDSVGTTHGEPSVTRINPVVKMKRIRQLCWEEAPHLNCPQRWNCEPRPHPAGGSDPGKGIGLIER
jgi:hypothetical protein